MANENLIDKYLRNLYYTPGLPASYSGAEKLWSYAKNDADRPEGITKDSVTTWLATQEAHQVHALPKTKFRTEAIIVEYLDDIWDGDILQLPV